MIVLYMELRQRSVLSDSEHVPTPSPLNLSLTKLRSLGGADVIYYYLEQRFSVQLEVQVSSRISCTSTLHKRSNLNDPAAAHLYGLYRLSRLIASELVLSFKLS